MWAAGNFVRVKLGILVAVAAGAAVAGAAVSGTGSAGSATLTLTPVADADVRADQPGRNFGPAAGLRVDGMPIANAYLRFNVNVPVGETVTRATLRVFTTQSSGSGF